MLFIVGAKGTLCDDMIGFSNRRLCGNSFHEYLNFV